MVAWDAYGTTIGRLPNNLRVAVSKACHNSWHTRVKHQQLYHKIRPCCMYHDQTEDWRHVCTCSSIDAALHRADSWVQLRQTLQCWKLTNDFWKAVEKRMQSYVAAPKKAKGRTILATPFSAQSKIGWDNLVKGRIEQEWIQFMENHYKNQGYKLKARDWVQTFIFALCNDVHLT
jgi:hypothetical protein